MNYISLTGIIGSVILVIGAAWPEPKNTKPPLKIIKNWLFTIGSTILLFYSIFNYQNGGQFFFILLQILVETSCIFMMLDIYETTATYIISFFSIGLLIWSILLFQGLSTIFFILGLSGISLGYIFKIKTLRRSIALTFGSILIAIFSFIEASWIFFWLNIFYALFSSYYIYRNRHF